MKKIKKCRACSIEKPIEEYHISHQGKTGPIYKARCKVCISKYQKEGYKKLSEEVKQDRRKKNPCNNFEWRKTHRLKSRYGLTTEDFSAMILEQQNKCKICGLDMKDPQVDHNHDTGKVRALLCRPCNTSLGMLKEDPQTIRNMLNYINDYLPED